MTEKTPTKAKLSECRQKLIALNARIKYRENALKGFKQHLKQGTFPRRVKSIKPYPKMDTPEAQNVVNAACEEVNKIILDQLIQEQTLKLKQDQDCYQTLKKVRQDQRQASKAKTLKTLNKEPKKTPKVLVLQLQRELKDLQTKYMKLEQTLKKQEPQES